MIRRLLVLALSFGITAAPVAVTLCQVLCADASEATARHHSCHTDAATPSATISGVPHACGHATEAPDSIEDSTPVPVAFVAVMPAALWTTLPVASGFAADQPVQQYPPGQPPPLTRLRV